MSVELYTKSELEEFKKAQKIAYESVLEAQTMLYEGITEKKAASLLDSILESKGVKNFFHTAFAWFGERTTFRNFNSYLDFLPTNTELQKKDCVILDVAPAKDGLAVDIGYTFAFGDNIEVEKSLHDLEIYRSTILSMVKAEKTMHEIYKKVDHMIHEMGYINCHKKYPLGVLGHKVGRMTGISLPRINIGGFQPQTYLYLVKASFESFLSFPFTAKLKLPYWNEGMNHTVEPGLWTMEPHFGKGNIGVKFEEILVVDDSDAYWLDNDLPHVNYWKKK